METIEAKICKNCESRYKVEFNEEWRFSGVSGFRHSISPEPKTIKDWKNVYFPVFRILSRLEVSSDGER